MGSTDWWGLGWEAVMIVSGPDVSPGVILRGFEGMWPVGSFLLHGSGAEIQLRLRCYLQFDQNSVSVINRPEAFFLRLTLTGI